MNRNSSVFKAIGIVSIVLGSLVLIALLLTLIAVAVGLSYDGTLAVNGFDTVGSMIGLLALGIVVAVYSFVLVGVGVSYLKFSNLTDAQCVRNKGSILGCTIMLTIWVFPIGALVFFPYVSIGAYNTSTTHNYVEQQGQLNEDLQQHELGLTQEEPPVDHDLNHQSTSQQQLDQSTSTNQTADVVRKDAKSTVANTQAQQSNVPQYNIQGSYDRQDRTLTPTQQRYFDNELAKYRKPMSIERHLNFLRDVRQRGLLTDQEYNDARDKAIEGQIKQNVKTKVS
ncbi:MAG: hypothetical protein LBK70_03280 [Clostridiales bacterium]|jgi:hypothetical protein|nr:hypothetical protein [Clostridiales bacterium]